MSGPRRSSRPGVVRMALGLGLLLPLILATDQCPGIDGDLATTEVFKYVETRSSISVNSRLRIHRYPEAVPEGTIVQPYTPSGTAGPGDIKTCGNEEGCLLFFVDTDHWAHFGHPTVTILWDPSATRPLQPVEGEWWPLVNGRPVFDKVRKREEWFDPDDSESAGSIVFPLQDEGRGRVPPGAGFSVFPSDSSVVEPVAVTPGLTTHAMVASFPVWAVLVAGFDDEGDSFFDDIHGMENVLRGYGVPPRQIFVLSPEYKDEPVESPGLGESVRLNATKENVEKILAEAVPTGINATGGMCGEVIFFYSSHGSVSGDEGTLLCEGADQYIDEDELNNWLNLIPCIRVTAILEACHSGSFLDPLGNIPTGIGPGSAQQDRVVVTSSTRNGSSWRDCDREEDTDTQDTNPGDIGSESIWGYLEALGTSAASSDFDNIVTINEAFDFAGRHDLSHVLGYNHPQTSPKPMPADKAHSWPQPTAHGGLKIELEQIIPTSPADFGQLLRPGKNRFSVTVDSVASAGTSPPRLTTARLYWTTEPNPIWDPSDQPHLDEVWDSSRLIPWQDLPYTFPIEWDVGKWLDRCGTITLVAVADSPDRPFRQGPIRVKDISHDQASVLTLEIREEPPCMLLPCGCVTSRP